MSWLTDLYGVGKSIYNSDWEGALESGGNLLSSAGPSIMKAYGTDQDQKSRNDSMDKVIAGMKEQEALDYARQMEMYQANQANAGARSKAKREALVKAQAAQDAAHKKMMGMLRPYIAAGKAELPVRAKIYEQGMTSLGDLLGSSQEALSSLPNGITSQTPKIKWA